MNKSRLRRLKNVPKHEVDALLTVDVNNDITRNEDAEQEEEEGEEEKAMTSEEEEDEEEEEEGNTTE
jgi:hypothetical protein